MVTDSPKTRGRVPYRDWLLRVICWDGALPAIVFLAPVLVKRALPNHPGAIELLAIALPITALVIRFVVGTRAIDSNHCREGFRRLQVVALGIALLILLFVDAFLALLQNMPNGALFAARVHLIVWMIFAPFYLIIMLIVMYPGRPAIEPTS